MKSSSNGMVGGAVDSLGDDLAVCVGCGLCLPHCPTFRETGEESHSPRGRISLVRGLLDKNGSGLSDVKPFLDTCVQCRGCEPACPSGVRYGRILASVHRLEEEEGQRPHHRVRLLLEIVRRPRLLRSLGRAALVATAIPGLRNMIPGSVRTTGVPLRQGRRFRRETPEPQVWVFTGCIMDSWFRSVHRATGALLEACGLSVSTPTKESCCGALHAHAGQEKVACDLAQQVMNSMPGDAPIVVNSAGCGAMLLEYGELLRTDEARKFSQRVIDVNEWIRDHCDELLALKPTSSIRSDEESVFIVQEPCHLRHVQRVSLSDVVANFVPIVRLDDDGLCCGAGGAYSLVQPDMSRAIRNRKSEAIRRASGGRQALVVTANPGCHLHLAADGHTMVSAAELVCRILGLLERERTGDA